MPSEPTPSFLVIAPHIDDEALGCGGVLDPRFHVHYCGVEAYRIIDRDARVAEAQACAELLGFTFTVHLENPVNDYRVVDLIGQLEAVLQEHRPTTVFLPFPSYNQDHRAVLDAGLTALRPHDRNHQVANVLLYEQIQVTVWPHRENLLRGQTFQPNYFVPIDIERKLAAYRCHESQVRGMRPPEMVEQVARWRGFQAGIPFAEAFQVLRLTAPEHLRLGTGRE